jgi:hypothetical protein
MYLAAVIIFTTLRLALCTLACSAVSVGESKKKIETNKTMKSRYFVFFTL